MARNTKKTETRNVAITINRTTVICSAKYLEGCKKAARTARDNGFAVSLAWTDQGETNLTADVSRSCDECECCGAFGAFAYFVETEWNESDTGAPIHAWACPRCAMVRTINRLAAKGR